MTAANIVRLAAAAGLLGLTGGCNAMLILGGTPLISPEDNAQITARFKATIQAQLHDPVPLDWGSADRNIWMRVMGPTGVAVCGRPGNARATRRPYQINYFRGWFESIDEVEVETPAHPLTDGSNSDCEPRPGGSP